MEAMIQPRNDCILIRRLPEPGAPTEGYEPAGPGTVRLITPESAMLRSRYGEVEAVGPGELWVVGPHKGERIKPSINVGDRVWWGARSEKAEPDEDHVITREDEIRAVERPDGTIGAIRNRLIVRRDPRKQQTKSGLWLGKTEPTYTGTVVAAGIGTLLDCGEIAPMDVKPGDHIMLRWHDEEVAAETVTFKGEELLVTTAADIVGVIG